MSQTNCCNCGAPLDIFSLKCEYCGTKNVNLTSIDLASHEAANFIFRLPNINKQELYMSLLAIPELTNIELQDETVDIVGGLGQRLCSYVSQSNLQMGLNLRAVAQYNNNHIYTLHYKEQEER